MKKNIIIGVVVLLVAVALVWQYASRNINEDTQRPGRSGPPAVQGEAKFILGQVTQVEAGAIHFSVSGSDKKTAEINESTVLNKQVKEGDRIKLVDARLADFTKGNRVVVYYLQDPQGDSYKATKVQVIDY